MRKKTFLVLFGVLAIFALGYQSWKTFFPLEASELAQKWEFWREGVQSVELSNSQTSVYGYLQDHCEKNSRSCSCVLLLHGLADNALTWKRLLLWPKTGWPEPVKLLALDLPGSGKSPFPQDLTELQVRKMSLKLKSVLSPLCPYWTVVGNSMGGWVASWLAIEWPEGVNKMLLLSSAGLKKLEQPSAVSAFSEPTIDSLKEFQKKAYYKSREIPDSVWKAIVERMKESHARQIRLAQVPEDDLEGKLHRVKAPTMVFWGMADQIIPMTIGKILQSQIPGSIWREVPECGHLPQKECPLQVIQAISQMIQLGAM